MVLIEVPCGFVFGQARRARCLQIAQVFDVLQRAFGIQVVNEASPASRLEEGERPLHDIIG
jgi:hypothetical protein